MPKEHTLNLGGKDRPLRYTRAERVAIENRFDCDIRTFIYERAFPIGADGKPTLGGRLECQEALIWYGLRHNGPKVTEEAVSKWLEEGVRERISVYVPLSQAIVAIIDSGLLGWTPPVVEDEKEGEGDEAGKASAGSTDG